MIVPDLLAEQAHVRVDAVQLRQTLVFAFAAGASLDTFHDALAKAALPDSTWDPAAFARDLFLEQLLSTSLSIRIGARTYESSRRYLFRVLSQPPRDARDVAFRRKILGELHRKKTARTELERIYVSLVGLRGLLAGGEAMARSLRRLDILRAIHALVVLLAQSFEGCSSGLSRIRALGEELRASDAYKRLEAVLDHESHLGTVDVRVRVGSDGEVRTFQIVKVAENRDNPFHSSAIGRFFAKLAMMFRGYRMNGGEAVERLFDEVFSGFEEALVHLVQLTGDIELYLASLSFADRAKAKGLAVSFPDLVPPGSTSERASTIDIEGLWNPLLLTDKRAPIPCDIKTAHSSSVVVVTGPNSGGKTRLFQAVALCQLLGQSGLFVPAAKARLPRAPGLFASLIDQASADAPEGHLGMELLRVRRMFEQIEIGSLVLLDELCAGTNPSEGEEIARLVITLLPELGVQVFVSTHLLTFAARLAEDPPIPRMEFLQVELGQDDRPTYRFVPGTARSSLAFRTAARLGVTREELRALIAAKAPPPASDPPEQASDPSPPFGEALDRRPSLD